MRSTADLEWMTQTDRDTRVIVSLRHNREQSNDVCLCKYSNCPLHCLCEFACTSFDFIIMMDTCAIHQLDEKIMSC